MGRPRIIHSVREYLPITQRWIWETLRLLEGAFDQWIYTDTHLAGSPSLDGVPVMVDRRGRWRRRWVAVVGVDVWGRLRLPHRAVLFSHFGPRGYHDLALRIRPQVVRFYGFDIAALPMRQPQWKPLYRRLFQRVDRFVVEGPAMKQALAKAGAPADRIDVLPIGIEPPAHPRIRTWDGTEPFRILLPHAIREKKGVLYAVRGIGQWYRRRRIPLEVHLVGDIPSKFDRPYWERVRAEIRRQGLGDVLHHHGFVSFDRLLSLATEAHAAVHASVTASDGDTEGGYPHVIPTLMAAGLPFITTRHADIPFVVGDAAMLVDERDADAIAAALDRLAEPAALTAWSRRAAERGAQWTWPRWKDDYIRFFEKAAAGRF